VGYRLTVPASESRGLRGEWLLEFVAEGRTFRYATRTVEVDGHVFAGGLAPFTRSLGRGADQQAIQIDDEQADWAGLELAGLDLERASCRLWWWYPGQTLDTALYVLSGLAENVEHSDPGALSRVVFTLNAATRARRYPEPSRAVDDTTWTVQTTAGGIIIGEHSWGQVVPTVFGYPGSGDANAQIRAAVPVLPVDFNGASGNTPAVSTPPTFSKLLLAPGPIDAAQVRVWDADDTSGVNGAAASDVLTVEQGADLLGQPVSYAYFNLAPYFISPWPTHRFYAGFGNEAGYGGGIKYNGEVLRGLGDILTWVLDKAAVGADLTMQRGEAEQLNQFQLDTYVNASGLDFVRWIETSLVPLFPIRRVRLGGGLWYRLENWLARKTDAVARLDTETGEIVRRSPKRKLRGPLYNRMTLAYQRDGLSGMFRARRILDGLAQERVLPTMQGYNPPPPDDVRTVGSPFVAESQSRFGILDRPPIETPHLWSHASASRLLEFYAARDALPLDGITYDGEQLDRILPGDVAVLNDPGAGVSERLAIVDDVIVGGPTVQIDTVLLPQLRRA